MTAQKRKKPEHLGKNKIVSDLFIARFDKGCVLREGARDEVV